MAVVPAVQQYHASAVKVWGSLVDGGTAALDSPDYGISTVDDNGTGDYDYNFSTAFSSAVFAPAGMVSWSGGVGFLSGDATTPRSTTDLRTLAHNGTNAVNAQNFGSVIICGDQ